MRKITAAELPEDYTQSVLIKNKDRKKCQQFSKSIEKMLSRCYEIRIQHEAKLIELQEKHEKKGIAAGFHLIYSQLLSLFERYEKMQQQRFSQFRQNLIQTLMASFSDPDIVKKIIDHLSAEYKDPKDEIKVIIPEGMAIPIEVTTLNYDYCLQNTITIQCGVEALCFPTEALVQQWIHCTDTQIEQLNKEIINIIPDVLIDMAEKLQILAHQSSSQQI